VKLQIEDRRSAHFAKKNPSPTSTVTICVGLTPTLGVVVRRISTKGRTLIMREGFKRQFAATRPRQIPPPPGGPDPVAYAEALIDLHLDRLGYEDNWTPERDFRLVEVLLQKGGVAAVAAQLKVSIAEVCRRWSLLNSKIGDLDHQHRLVAVLRRRSERGLS
jgi:hypothetical protein